MLAFYNDKRVLVTGHTGFKGSWLCRMLVGFGADVTGYALAPNTSPALFDLAGLTQEAANLKSQIKQSNNPKSKNSITSVIGDIRDFDHLKAVFDTVQPEIVLHLAAQPIVRESYKSPRYTYETNVMGTVNVLECVRTCPSVKSFLNVTTDKVYCNDESNRAFRETDPLDGFDPYSNSKSCSELVTHSYRQSFFSDGHCAISTARAGNVIGGGDFSADRIIPDCVRAMAKGEVIKVRNPHSTRPYQHVLEPLAVYLTIAQKQYEDGAFAGYYNVGPDDCDCVTTGQLADLFCKHWGPEAKWINLSEANAPHEAGFLKLDNGKIKDVFGWKPRWHIDECMAMTVRFSKVWLSGSALAPEMDSEIKEFTSTVDLLSRPTF